MVGWFPILFWILNVIIRFFPISFQPQLQFFLKRQLKLKKVRFGVWQIHNLFRIYGLKRDFKNNVKDFRNDIRHYKTWTWVVQIWWALEIWCRKAFNWVDKIFMKPCSTQRWFWATIRTKEPKKHVGITHKAQWDVSLRIMDKLKYWNIKKDMNEVDYCVHQVQIDALEVFEVTMNIWCGFYSLCMNIKQLPTIIEKWNQ